MKFAKDQSLFTLKSFSLIVAALTLTCIVMANSAKADNWFDVNGTTAGYGTVGGGSYSWDDPNWATAAGGTSATGAWVPGSFARFLGTGSYTVTANNPESNAGLFQAVPVNSGLTLTINAAGSGNLSIVPNPTLTTGLPVQGFFCNGGNTLTINAPITGTGGINFGLISGTGTINLNGNNTYSGGSTLTTSSYLIQFNNNNAFGSGPININGTTFAALLAQGGSTITLANNWTNTANGGVNFASSANTPVVLTGPLALQTFSLNLRNNGNNTAPLTLQGVISGSGSLNLTANNGGTIFLSGANTYSGATTIGVGGNSGANPIVSVSSLNSVTGGSANSSLGHPTTVAAGTIGIGSAAVLGTLVYTGPGETSDRVINLAGTTGGATLEADGTGALVLTANNTATGAGTKSLTLQGTSTAANSIGKIVDSSGGATAVVKAQAGTWKLTGANTYTGGTTVNGGALEISGSVAGSVTNAAGVLTLDSVATLGSTATLAVSSGSTVNLNFTGTNAINALVIDGAGQVSGVWGPNGSTAPNQSPTLAGTGFINVLGKPVVAQQPVSGSVFLGDTTSFAFSVGVAGDVSSLTYQWKQNGNNIPGATTSTYAIPSPVTAASAGNYSCALTNAFGFTVSSNATLFVLATNAYTQTIRGDGPISYWRLDETNGGLAFDNIGGNIGQYKNVLLKQPGYSVADTDSGIGLPASGAAGRGYVSVTNFAPFSFVGIPAFSLEGWAYFTNLTGVQRLFSTFALTGGHGWAFGINGNNGLRFTSGTHQDADVTLNSSLVTGVWYHLMCTCDGSSYFFYLNGSPVGTVAAFTGNDGTSQPLTLGCNPVTYTNSNTGDPLGEQVRGRIDEISIYGYQLDDSHVMNHYLARYADAPAPVPAMPVVSPPTNYVSRTTTLQENAAGVNLNYQWYKAPSTVLTGQTGSAMTLSPLQLSDAGDYYVQVSNNNGVTNSPTNYVAVLPIPTNASQLNLTNGLVLHLPFDGDYRDISGRANNGTNVGATTFVTDGVIGGKALHYFSDAGSSSYNYVSLGVRPDLQFGSSTDFTVSYWVRQPAGSSFTNLPFFTDEPIGATTGFSFAPYATATTAGGWSEAIGSMTSPSAFTSFPDSNLINDGNWHHLVHSAQRTANVTTYLDGTQVDSEAIGFLGSISTTTPATIGQDSSGAYAVTASADIDDVAVWTRPLTSFEVSGIYLAGASNNVSFALSAPIPLQIQQVSPGQYQLVWTGSGWTLQAGGDVFGTYTNVPGATSPYPIPTPMGVQLFYRLKQ